MVKPGACAGNDGKFWNRWSIRASSRSVAASGETARSWMAQSYLAISCMQVNNPCTPAQSIVFTRERSRITRGGSFLISVFNSRMIFFASFGPRDSGRLITIPKEVTMSAFSVGDLMNFRSATSVLGTLKHHSWQLHVNDFGSHRIQNQLNGGMKIQLDHDIAAMHFCPPHDSHDEPH
jgi:hypothetical protein